MQFMLILMDLIYCIRDEGRTNCIIQCMLCWLIMAHVCGYPWNQQVVQWVLLQFLMPPKYYWSPLSHMDRVLMHLSWVVWLHLHSIHLIMRMRILHIMHIHVRIMICLHVIHQIWDIFGYFRYATVLLHHDGSTLHRSRRRYYLEMIMHRNVGYLLTRFYWRYLLIYFLGCSLRLHLRLYSRWPLRLISECFRELDYCSCYLLFIFRCSDYRRTRMRVLKFFAH